MIYGVLDIETTGLDKRSHRIIEVGIRVIQDRDILPDCFHEYINPEGWLIQVHLLLASVMNS